MSNSESVRPIDFESVKTRLAEIAEQVDDDDVSLDEALALYEEAVVLGLQASDLLETGIAVPEEEPVEGEGESEGAPVGDRALQEGAASGGMSAESAGNRA